MRASSAGGSQCVPPRCSTTFGSHTYRSRLHRRRQPAWLRGEGGLSRRCLHPGARLSHHIVSGRGQALTRVWGAGPGDAPMFADPSRTVDPGQAWLHGCHEGMRAAWRRRRSLASAIRCLARSPNTAGVGARRAATTRSAPRLTRTHRVGWFTNTGSGRALTPGTRVASPRTTEREGPNSRARRRPCPRPDPGWTPPRLSRLRP
jgi:hypothetical protein